MSARDWIILGAVGVAGFWLYRKVTSVPEALARVGESASAAVFEFFHPNAVGETLFYTVNFSNGRHAIPASTVDSQGRFTFRGAKFVMRDKVVGTKREHWAFAA